jgi:hypothetical protein
MHTQDVVKLLADLEHELLSGARLVGILGLTSVTVEILASLAPSGLASTIVAAYVPGADAVQRNNLPLSVPVLPFAALSGERHDVLVVAADDEKEDLLRAAVFDHFTGVDRFRYALGEWMAGSVLLDDPRYFHLHETGVFYRQCLTR